MINQYGESDPVNFEIILPPQVTITSPQAEAEVPDTGFTFSGTAEDDTGIAEVQVYVYDYGRSQYTVQNQLASYDAGTKQWNFEVLPEHITAGNRALLYVRAKNSDNYWSGWKSIYVDVE